MDGALEIEALVGAVIELGRLTETPTPHIDSVYACTRLLAKTIAEAKGTLKISWKPKASEAGPQRPKTENR